MRVSAIVAGLAIFAAGSLLGYAGAVAYIPYAATDQVFQQFRRAGRKTNTLSRPAVRDARRNIVVRDNADTITQSAMVDLKPGPLIYRTVVPRDAVYWSVSLFAHGTDTVYIASDRTLKPGPFSLLIRTKAQAAGAPADATAISPSRRSFLIVRYVMPNRNDAASVAAIKAQMSPSTLTRAR